MATLLDGAMGTELQRRGVKTDLPLWSARALLECPDEVLRIHADYVEAGAEVLTANTFRTHRRSLAKAGLGDRAEEATRLAVRLARDAASAAERAVRVAGSVSPLEDCYRPDLSPGKADEEFREVSEWMADAGADLLLIETMNNCAEIRSAVRAAQRAGLPFWLSANPSNADASTLLSGEPVREALRIAEGEGAGAFLVNCASVSVIEEALAEIAARARLRFGGYANNGTEDPVAGWRFDRELPPEGFAEHGVRLLDLGASIVGGCCGTTPDHIAGLRAAVGAA